MGGVVCCLMPAAPRRPRAIRSAKSRVHARSPVWLGRSEEWDNLARLHESNNMDQRRDGPLPFVDGQQTRGLTNDDGVPTADLDTESNGIPRCLSGRKYRKSGQ